jgi:uncharacterized protein
MGTRKKLKRSLRVVLDTNVVLSALLFTKGRLTWLREAWQGNLIIPLVARVTVEELVTVFNYPKFKLSASEQEDLLADFLPFCETITIPDPPPLVPDCRDSKDLPFLWLAVAGKANFLVTGDTDLLTLSQEFSILIVTADILRERLIKRSEVAF